MEYVHQNVKCCIDKTAAAIHNYGDADNGVQWQTSRFAMETMEWTTERNKKRNGIKGIKKELEKHREREKVCV